jgi:hypothetical protein
MNYFCWKAPIGSEYEYLKAWTIDQYNADCKAGDPECCKQMHRRMETIFLLWSDSELRKQGSSLANEVEGV